MMTADGSLESTAYHKVDVRLLPFLFLCYILSALLSGSSTKSLRSCKLFPSHILFLLQPPLFFNILQDLVFVGE